MRSNLILPLTIQPLLIRTRIYFSMEISSWLDLLIYVSSFIFIYTLQFYSRSSEKVSFTDVEIREIKVAHIFLRSAG